MSAAAHSPGYARTRAKFRALYAVQRDTAPADDLIAFARATFPRYQPAPHHHLIAERLMAVERGEIDRLMIFMPPRHGKTQLASIHFPAWYLGRNPDKRILAASYAASLAYRISRQSRNLVGAPGWPFRDVRLASDLSAVQQWDIADHRGGYQAAGVGGGLTGGGGHIILIDDPVKNQEEADSANYRESVWGWFQSVAYTRQEEQAAIVLIMTRWHADDLAGRLLTAQANGGDHWEVLHLPAVAEDGSALWPEKYDEAALARIKAAVGSRVFAALYQGQPSNDDTAMLKREWWRFYGGPTGHALPTAFDQSLQSWDMTFKGGVANDYVAGQLWEKAGADCYLTDRVKERLDFPATLDALRGMTARRPDVVTKLVEDTANGPAVIATLQHEIGGIVAVRPEGGKVARVNAIAGLVEAGNVYLPHPSIAPWVAEFIEECTAFPTGAHDDEVDAMSQALVRLAAETPATYAVGGSRLPAVAATQRHGGGKVRIR